MSGRRAHISGGTWAVIVLASVLVHLAVVLLVRWDLDHTRAPVAKEKTAPSSLVSYSCELNAAAGSLAQLAICTTPFGGGLQACLRDAGNQHLLTYLGCKRESEQVVVSMVDIDKIKPMKLLPIEPVDEVVATQLLEQEVVKKIEQAQKKIEQKTAPAQVVEITPPDVQIRPENARFVSEYDSQTQKEMVARASTEDMVARPSPKEVPVADNSTELPDELTSLKELTEGSETAENTKAKTADSSGLLAMRGAGQSERSPQKASTIGKKSGSTAEISSDGLNAARGDGAHRAQRTENEPKGGEGGEQKSGGIPNLRPSKEILTRTLGGGSVDKLDGVDSGEFTALNSKKWKYASFFNRMKRRVAQHWHPDKVYMRRDPTGKVYGVKDRVTTLRVSLKPNGAIANIIVGRRSDIRFLDDEAIRAFREAGPFPNPPGGLVESSGLITFSFGFHFQIGGRPGAFRIFRRR